MNSYDSDGGTLVAIRLLLVSPPPQFHGLLIASILHIETNCAGASLHLFFVAESQADGCQRCDWLTA